jgi:hypothetical protein
MAFKTKGKGKLQNRLQGMREKTQCLFNMHTITPWMRHWTPSLSPWTSSYLYPETKEEFQYGVWVPTNLQQDDVRNTHVVMRAVSQFCSTTSGPSTDTPSSVNVASWNCRRKTNYTNVRHSSVQKSSGTNCINFYWNWLITKCMNKHLYNIPLFYKPWDNYKQILRKYYLLLWLLVYFMFMKNLLFTNRFCMCKISQIEHQSSASQYL